MPLPLTQRTRKVICLHPRAVETLQILESSTQSPAGPKGQARRGEALIQEDGGTARAQRALGGSGQRRQRPNLAGACRPGEKSGDARGTLTGKRSRFSRSFRAEGRIVRSAAELWSEQHVV